MPFHPAPNLKLPEPLDGYTLIERLGRGGFGEVWKCEAPGGFQKAVKFVYGDLQTEDGRGAEQELKSLGRMKDIRHPYILTLERYDVIDGQLMVVMELADRNLWDRFRECRMLGHPGIGREELLRYMGETAEALDLMNDRYKLQHLDVKPQNLFLMFDHIKVADFGLAKAFEGSVAAVTGGVTPVYAAPETFQGEVSRFSDQYSLGIVYQELLTGTRPFNGANTKQLLLQHLREPPDLSALPEHDRPVIGRALEKDPSDRWTSCREMVQRLTHAPTLYARAAAGALPLPLPADPPADRPAGPRVSATPTAPVETRRPAVDPAAGVFTQPVARTQDVRTVPQTPPGNGGLLAPAAVPMGTPLSPAPGRGLSGFSTPLPSLVTPRMAGPRAAAPARSMGHTQARQAVVETGRMGALGIAPPERTGDGVLFPVVVVGLGRTGLEVIRHLRRMIRDRFVRCEAVPTVRFLYLDTDADATAAAASAVADALPPQEVVLARLNRPAHYLQREGLPAVDQWLPPNTLYRLPKSGGPAAGVRAFGRLALMDNYRLVAQRIRHQIEQFLTDDLLDKTAAATGLGVRTNRPRVYVAAGLGGGTGGGMFLDVAYLLKHELRNVGYRSPEVHALLVAPPTDKAVSRLTLANGYAGLTELNHFCREKYQARFDMNEPPVTDTTPPFDRVALCQWPRKPKPADEARVVGGVARAVFLDLFTPVGRRVDAVRAAAPTDPLAGPVVQPFGVYRLSWPRYELLAALTRRFCQQVLGRWTSKETAHLKEPIAAWLDEQWTAMQLTPAAVTARLERAAADALRGPPEAAFDAAVTALAGGAAKVDGQAAVNALDQILKLVGKPEVEGASGTPAVVAAVDPAVKHIHAEAEASLATLAVSFIEQPQYRLAGADEALAQMTARMAAVVEQVEHEYRQTAKAATDTYARLFPLIGSLVGGSALSLVGRRGSLSAEVRELLALYPRQRYKTVLLAAAMSLFRKLRDGMPEYARDVTYCRERLTGFAARFAAQETSAAATEPGSLVLPVGCDTLDAAADRFIAALPPDDLMAFDQQVQADLTRKFRGLVGVCLKADRADRFVPLFADAARAFLDARLEKANPAEALTRYRGSGPECLSVLEDAYLGACPSVVPVSKVKVEATLLAAPDGPDGDRLRALVEDANPGVDFTPAALPDDVLVYREYPRLPIADLPQLGPAGESAYAAVTATDFPPHARHDVAWTAPGRPVPT